MTVDQAAIIALVAVLVGLEACGGSDRTYAQRALDGVRAPAEQDDAEVKESLGLRALAAQGHDLAQFNLGSRYLNGQGVPRRPLKGALPTSRYSIPILSNMTLR